MNKKFAIFTIVLLLLVCITTWLSLQIVESYSKQHINKPHNTDSIAIKVIDTQMDENGHRHYVIYTPKLIHYPYLNSSVFQKPDIIIINSKQQPWHITAEHGNSKYGTKIVQLWDHVKLHQEAGPNNKELTIFTNAATIYLSNKYITTNQPVTILQPGITINALGANIDLNKKIVELLSNIRETYEPNK